jgi:hypothetical protein
MRYKIQVQSLEIADWRDMVLVYVRLVGLIMRWMWYVWCNYDMEIKLGTFYLPPTWIIWWARHKLQLKKIPTDCALTSSERQLIKLVSKYTIHHFCFHQNPQLISHNNGVESELQKDCKKLGSCTCRVP